MTLLHTLYRYFQSGRKAFSLIEINIAILVIAGGLLVIMAVFPAALRLSTSATSETRQVTFASFALNVARYEAGQMSRAEWLETPDNKLFCRGFQDRLATAINQHLLDVAQRRDDLNIKDYLVTVKASPQNPFTKYVVIQSTDTPDISVSNSTPYQLTLHYHP